MTSQLFQENRVKVKNLPTSSVDLLLRFMMRRELVLLIVLQVAAETDSFTFTRASTEF